MQQCFYFGIARIQLMERDKHFLHIRDRRFYGKRHEKKDFKQLVQLQVAVRSTPFVI